MVASSFCHDRKSAFTHRMAFLGIPMHIFPKKYHQHVRNAVLAVCAKPVPVWGKIREMGGKIILTCPLSNSTEKMPILNNVSNLKTSTFLEICHQIFIIVS